MQQHIKSLDGLRAIAILLVMAFHFGIIRFGWMGVQLFFVLSGFLIGGILLREKDTQSTLGARLRKFWIRRSLRIFPVYYFYLLIFIVVFLATGFPPYYKHDLPYLASYTFNLTRASSAWHESPVYTHFWSLCVEEQFYLFFPFIVFGLSKRSLKVLTICLVVLCPLFRWWATGYLQGMGKTSFEIFDIIYWFPFSHLDAFFMGAALPLFALPSKVKQPAWLFVAAAGLALGAGLLNYKIDNHGHSLPVSMGYNFGDINTGQQVWYYSVLNITAATFLLVLTGATSRLQQLFNKILINPVASSIGKVSYGMYIFHWAIQTQIMQRFFTVTPHNKYLYFAIDIPIVYICALGSYYIVEQYFVKMKDKWAGATIPARS